MFAAGKTYNEKLAEFKAKDGYPFQTYTQAKAAALAVDPGFLPYAMSQPSMEKYLSEFFNDANVSNIEKTVTLFSSKVNAQIKKQFIKANIVECISISDPKVTIETKEKIIDFYIAKIMPTEDDADAKKVLKTLNKIIYPKIDDEKYKKMAVKIKLALESLE